MWPALKGFLPCHHNSTSRPAPARSTDRSSPGPGHCGPEEAPPVRVLKDVGQHAREQPAAVQDNLLLLLRMAAALSSLHQLLNSLRGWAERHAGRLGSGALALGVRLGTPGFRGGETVGPPYRTASPARVSQPRRMGHGPGSSLEHPGSETQPTTHWLRSC